MMTSWQHGSTPPWPHVLWQAEAACALGLWQELAACLAHGCRPFGNVKGCFKIS